MLWAPCRLAAFLIDFSTSLDACCGAALAAPGMITVHLRRNNANFGTFTRRRHTMHNSTGRRRRSRWRRQLPRQRYVSAFNTSLKSYFAETARLDVLAMPMMMPAQLSLAHVAYTQRQRDRETNGRQDTPVS